jgi:GTP:adenosylcobinamide-phosphate guanylyltransferase
MPKNLIILSGGLSRRMGSVGQRVPKSILPLHNTCLLSRQVAQAVQAGVARIFISTLPHFKLQIEEAIKTELRDGSQFEVLANPHHRSGIIAGLVGAINASKSREDFLISLADIFYLEDPFRVDFDASVTTLFGAPAFQESELERGGVVFTKAKVVSGLAAAPILGNKLGLRWSGLSYLAAEDQKALFKFGNGCAPDEPLESFFLYLLSLRRKIHFELISDFINNNSVEQFAVSLLYQLADLHPNVAAYAKAAEHLRSELTG